MPTLFRLFLSLLYVVVSSLALAEESKPGKKPAKKNAFLIEAVIFRHVNELSSQANTDNEFWNTVPPALTRSDPEDLAKVRFLETSNLSAAIELLRTNPKFEVLSQVTWVQPSTLDASPWIPVQGLSTVLSDVVSPDQELDGVLRFQRAHFLHMEARIVYSPFSLNPGQVQSVNAAGSLNPYRQSRPVFVLNEKRRIKINELHYFDHPKIGLLVRVSRIHYTFPTQADIPDPGTTPILKFPAG